MSQNDAAATEEEAPVEIVYVKSALDTARSWLGISAAELARLEAQEASKKDVAQQGRLGIGAKFLAHNQATLGIAAGIERNLQRKLQNAKERKAAKEIEDGRDTAAGAGPGSAAAATQNGKRRIVEVGGGKGAARTKAAVQLGQDAAAKESDKSEDEDVRKGSGSKRQKGVGDGGTEPPAVINRRDLLLGLKATPHVQLKPPPPQSTESKAEKRRRKKAAKKAAATGDSVGGKQE